MLKARRERKTGKETECERRGREGILDGPCITVARSLFIFVHFGARDNALVTDRQVWTKCPGRHSIGPRGHSSSLRLRGEAGRNGLEKDS